MTPSTGPNLFLDTLVAEAAADLQGVDHGAPVCAADRANRQVAGLKHTEGRWAALRGVQREAARGADLADALDRARARWQADLDLHRARESGRDWIAYCTGGVEALDQLAEALGGDRPAWAVRLAQPAAAARLLNRR